MILERLQLTRADATRPEIVASETITRVDANQAQLVNRLRSASLLLESETMFLLELQPAAYVAVAANEAEKRARVKLVYAAVLGASGRMIVSGRDDEVAEARTAALAASGPVGRISSGRPRKRPAAHPRIGAGLLRPP